MGKNWNKGHSFVAILNKRKAFDWLLHDLCSDKLHADSFGMASRKSIYTLVCGRNKKGQNK